MDFYFGDTPDCKAFFNRHPDFHPAVDRLLELTNNCFGRSFQPKDRTEEICFHLGQTCRDDYLEILFLASNGYGIGASKLLRGLYERTVALAYMVKHRDKAERFTRFAAIQEYKAMVAALRQVLIEQFDEAVCGKTTVAQIKELREKVKPEFLVEVCKRLQTPRDRLLLGQEGCVVSG
jgi:hypothetical protein